MATNNQKGTAPDSQGKHWAVPVSSMAGIVLLSNILVQYPVGEWLTWGAFSYPVTYFVTDVCNRWAGPRLARRVAWAGFMVGVVLSLIMSTAQIALASGAAFITSQLLDISVFNQLRRKSWWIAPLIGSAVASLVDTVIFFSIAFHGSGLNWVQLAAGDLSVKLAMALVLLVPFRPAVRLLARLNAETAVAGKP